MEASPAEIRSVRWLQTATADTENANISLQGPGGFRVFVPPAIGPEDEPAAPTGGSCPVAGEEFTPTPQGHYAGRYTPLFRGRMVFGPQPKRFAASIIVFMVVLFTISIQWVQDMV